MERVYYSKGWLPTDPMTVLVYHDALYPGKLDSVSGIRANAGNPRKGLSAGGAGMFQFPMLRQDAYYGARDTSGHLDATAGQNGPLMQLAEYVGTITDRPTIRPENIRAPLATGFQFGAGGP